MTALWKMNKAQQLLERFGIATADPRYLAYNGKMPSFTKKGPGRYHQQGKRQ